MFLSGFGITLEDGNEYTVSTRDTEASAFDTAV